MRELWRSLRDAVKRFACRARQVFLAIGLAEERRAGGQRTPISVQPRFREPRSKDDLDFRPALTGPMCQLAAVDAAWHHDVGQEQIDALPIQQFETCRRIPRCEYPVAELAELARNDAAQRLVVFDHQNRLASA